MGLAETLQIDEMIQDFKRMNKRQVNLSNNKLIKKPPITTTTTRTSVP